MLNGEAYNHKADMWSLGCIIYKLVTLRPPFNGSSMMALMLAISKGQYQPIPAKPHLAVASFAVKLLQVDPARRPSAEQMDGYDSDITGDRSHRQTGIKLYVLQGC